MSEKDQSSGQRTILSRISGWAVCVGLVGSGLGLLSYFRSVDLDLFHEMAWFREALTLRAIPTEDVFAYTPTVSPVVHHEWGTGAITYLLTVTLGTGSWGLALLRILLLAGVAFLCMAIARRRGAGVRELVAAAPVGIMMMLPGLSPVRAHMFTFLLLAVLLYVLERERHGSRIWSLAWIPLCVVWVNVHGGVVVGIGMLGLYTAERFVQNALTQDLPTAFYQTRYLLVSLLLTPVLLLINPFGWDYLPYLWHAIQMDRPMIAEWSPLWQVGFGKIGLPVLLAALLSTGYSIRNFHHWRSSLGLSMVLMAAVFGLQSVRLLPLFAIVWMAYVPAALTSTPLATLIRVWWERYRLAISAGFLCIGVLGLWRASHHNPFAVIVPGTPETTSNFPVGAVEYLATQGFQGNLMTPFAAGAYVSWHLYPAVRVGLDSRYEVAYPPEFVEEALAVYRGDAEWQGFLDRYPTHAVLTPALGSLDSALVDAAAQGDTRWFEVYRDDAYSIFARDDRARAMPVVDHRGKMIRGSFP